MKKIIISVVGVLVIAVLLLPLVGAYKTEQTFNNWIAQVNQMGAYDLGWETYDKGWLQTRAVLKVGFKAGLMPSASTDEGENDWYLPLNVELNHGPILWLDGIRLGWFSGDFFLHEEHEMWLERNLKKEGEGHFFVSKVYMNLLGNTTLQDRSLPFSITTGSGETIQVSGYDGAGTIERSGTVEYSGKLPGFSVVGGAVDEAIIEDVLFRFRSDFGRKVGNYVVPGNGEFSIKKIAVQGDEDISFVVSDLLMSSDTQINEAQTLADFAIKIAFADMDVMGETMSNVRLDLDVANISTVFLDQYLALVQSTYDGQGEANPMLAMQMMGVASEHLVPGGPEFNVHALRFTTREGSLEFAGSLAVAPEAAQQMSNPMAMLSYLTVDASLLVDKPLAFRLVRQSTMRDLDSAQFEGGDQMTEGEKEALADNQTHMKLDTLTIQGMLVDKGERYSSEFNFKDGKAVLNGQPLPLPF